MKTDWPTRYAELRADRQADARVAVGFLLRGDYDLAMSFADSYRTITKELAVLCRALEWPEFADSYERELAGFERTTNIHRTDAAQVVSQ